MFLLLSNGLPFLPIPMLLSCNQPIKAQLARTVYTSLSFDKKTKKPIDGKMLYYAQHLVSKNISVRSTANKIHYVFMSNLKSAMSLLVASARF